MSADTDTEISAETDTETDNFRSLIVIMNPDSKKICFVPYETNPDLFRIVDHKSLMFSKDLFCGFIS